MFLAPPTLRAVPTPSPRVGRFLPRTRVNTRLCVACHTAVPRHIGRTHVREPRQRVSPRDLRLHRRNLCRHFRQKTQPSRTRLCTMSQESTRWRRRTSTRCPRSTRNLSGKSSWTRGTRREFRERETRPDANQANFFSTQILEFAFDVRRQYPSVLTRHPFHPKNTSLCSPGSEAPPTPTCPRRRSSFTLRRVAKKPATGACSLNSFLFKFSRIVSTKQKKLTVVAVSPLPPDACRRSWRATSDEQQRLVNSGPAKSPPRPDSGHRNRHTRRARRNPELPEKKVESSVFSDETLEETFQHK